MADTLALKPCTPGSPKKRVTLSAGKDHENRNGSATGRKTPGSPNSGEYSKPVVRSAVRRWKRLHEQNMMEKLVVIRNEKKQNVRLSKDDAKKVARKIPIEILAREWLNDNEATLEVRAYLVDKVLPTLILGVEKLLNEADSKGLAEEGEVAPNFNPINFLAQYLMRNNPKYCNLSEASPYVRGLREVADDLKKQLFNIEDNRLARIKAEAKRRREERDRLELLKQQEKERRETAFMDQFSNWNVQPDGRVELSIVQNALRSFVEIAETFPEELQNAAKLSHALEPTDETGKSLTVKEFARYMGIFVEELSKEIFDEFMTHLSKCATSHRAAASREARRILLTNLFITCDHSGIGLLDRHRILSLFESYWDSLKEDIKRNLRNPRRWPVAEVDEVVDYFDDDEFDKPEEAKPEEVPQTQQHSGDKQEEVQQDTTADGATTETATEGDKPKEGEAAATDAPKETEGEKPAEGEAQQQEVTQEVAKQEVTQEEAKQEEAKQEEQSEKKEEKTEEKPEEKAGEKVEEKPAEKTEEKPAEKVEEETQKEEPTKTDEVVTDGQTKTETKEVSAEKTEDGTAEKTEESPTDKPEEGTTEKAEEEATEKKEDGTGEEDGGKEGEKESPKEGDEAAPEVKEDPPKTVQAENTLVTFAVGTTFSREKTVTHISKTSGASAFDENSLNVSQFVQLTETFLGEETVEKDTFETLTKFVKGGYEETEDEKMERLMKARKEALSSQRKYQMDILFEKWDNDGAGYLDLDEVETVMQKYKEGQENQAIERAKVSLKKQAKYSQDNRLSRREFRQFVLLVVEELPGADSFDYFVEFLVNSVERTYAERIRGEARKKWLQQVVNAAETGGASMEPVYKAIFNALYKDAEAHGGGKRISANISMLERNILDPSRGDVCLRYVAATVDDSAFLLGKILFSDMKGISFSSVENGKPIHVPRVYNHGNIQFWNPYRVPEDREGSFIVVPLKDKRKRVFGLLGIDTLNDRHTKTIFITHEIQFFQGVAKSFSIAYHHVDMSKKLLRITESAVSWIHRRSPHVHEITTYMVEPEGQEKDYVLRKMMTTDAKGNVINMTNPPRLERKDNLFRDYLFKCVDNSESVSADAYGQRHLGFPLRNDSGKAVAVVDISIGELKQLPTHENKEVQRMLRLLQQAHKEITRESAGDDKLMVLEAEKDDDNRMDIMFDRLMLMELRENVSKIDSKGFAELRSYNDPPKIINDIVRAVCAIFYYEKVVSGELDNWGELKGLINSDLLQKIEHYDPTSTENQELIAPDKIEVYLKDVPHGEVAKFGSIPAQNMYNWVFVCISLIEHTLKMRKNSDDGALLQSGQEEVKAPEPAPEVPTA
ncbi:EF-hand calcium-binding domain-containing protein 5-like isoform X2 [Mizuhopecten yessoensis]|uniref:EF-hand calcium-binding domain-containing protein 5-like isoform X2 n=1 Tax=Mizuhopecten yessoensis TaxID=6573 RepID=UPI000B45E49F|nr:EF-hand calcium-binding domain-containing protein 5-like isoform X2 [Mizuhopecten yessoensis]